MTQQRQKRFRSKSSIAYKMAMPPVSDSQLTDYKAAVIAEKPAELAKIVAAIQDIPASAKAAQQAKQVQEQTEKMLLLAASADFDQLKKITIEVQKQGILDLMIQPLEAEAAKTDAPPSVFITLSVLYDRKNLKTQSYAALELAEKAPVPPDMNLNISLLYGRKKLLASATDAKTFMVGNLEITPTPTDATIFLDDVEKGTGVMTLSKVAAGAHIIKGVYPDYDDFITSIELGVGQTQQVPAYLSPIPGYLEFSTQFYVGYWVLIDGAKYSSAASPVKVFPGIHIVEVHNVNSKPIIETIEFKPRQTITRNWQMEPAINFWNIYTIPSGATVTIDNQIIGVSPLTHVPILAGIHDVICEAPGKKPFQTKENFLARTEGYGLKQIGIPFLIPTKTIKMDGKNDDWADVPRIDTASTFWPPSDPEPKLAGNMLTKTLICQDKTFVYWYMEFSDGKPSYSTGYTYQAELRKELDAPQIVALKLGNYKVYDATQLTWKPEIPTNLRSTNTNTWEDLWNGLGSSSHFRVGKNFIEARFSRALLLKGLSETEPLYLNFSL